ncbi:MAG: hypothetical protein KIS66_06505 [Fimbriimonadaceae bacterium]|nr:hypothetical protein [Fimbriimonadaceae bacterium]
MLTTVALTSLLALSRFAAPATTYEKMVQAFDKVVKTAAIGQKAVPGLGFHSGACLLGGSVNEGGKLSYTVSVQTASEYAVFVGAYGDEPDVKIEVLDPSGKNVVTDSDETLAAFDAKASTRYTIVAKNKGADTFIAVGLMRESGGIKYPTESVTKAVARMAGLVDEGFGEGFGLDPNSAAVIGTVLEPNGNYPRAGSKSDKWLALGTSDGVAGDVRLSVLDKDKNVVQEDKGEDIDCACYFEKSIPGATMQIANRRSKKVLALTATMSR